MFYDAVIEFILIIRSEILSIHTGLHGLHTASVILITMYSVASLDENSVESGIWSRNLCCTALQMFCMLRKLGMFHDPFDLLTGSVDTVNSTSDPHVLVLRVSYHLSSLRCH